MPAQKQTQYYSKKQKGHLHSSGFVQFATGIVAVLFAAILVVLFAMALFSTSYLAFGDKVVPNEYTFLLPSNPLFGLLSVLALGFLSVFCSTRALFKKFCIRLEEEKYFRCCKLFLVAILALVALIWIALMLPVPRSDQGALQRSVVSAVNGDWSSFERDKYMGWNPHQIGFFSISFPFVFVFGEYASAVFMLVNTAALVLIAETTSAIAMRLGVSRFTQLSIIALYILFFPLVQYSTFVYGTMGGLAFSLLAIRLEMDFFKHRKWHFAIGSALSIAVAIMFKSNYKVFLIGMVLYAVLDLIDKRKLETLGLCACLACAVALQSVLPIAAIETASGYKIESAESPWSYIAMGLQDGKYAAGWYNRYNKNSYIESEYKTAKHKELAQESIRQSFSEFQTGQRNALSFFAKKTASQWNNPTFQAYWDVQMCKSAFPLNPISEYLISTNGLNMAIPFLSFMHIAILAGAVLWILLLPRHSLKNYTDFVLALVFLGGFTCHLFWEGKAQYTLIYFVLLIPYCAMGFERFVESMRSSTDEKEPESLANVFTSFGKALNKKWLTLCAACSIVVVILGFAGGYDAITCDQQIFDKWLASDPAPRILTEEARFSID